MHIPILLPSIRGTGLVAVEALLMRAWIAFAIGSMQGAVWEWFCRKHT